MLLCTANPTWLDIWSFSS